MIVCRSDRWPRAWSRVLRPLGIHVSDRSEYVFGYSVLLEVFVTAAETLRPTAGSQDLYTRDVREQ